MKLTLVAIVLCAAICVATSTKLLTSSRQLTRRETNMFRRLFKRQAYNDPNCNRRACAVPNCGKDFVAATLPGECCERCVPWEYAQSIGIRTQPQSQHGGYNPYNPQPQPQNNVDVYIYGPDEGARVSVGQSIYFDCEVTAPYNQYAQPRWTRAGNQPLPYKAQSTVLSGNRKLARLAIPDATYSEAGRYECSAGTGNPSDVASIDLQVTEGGYYPRPQPQPQPQPHYPNYDPYNPYPYNPQPQPQPQPQPHPQPQPQPQPDNNDQDEGADEDGGAEDDEEQPEEPRPNTPANVQPEPAGQDEGAEEEGDYPEDYSETE